MKILLLSFYYPPDLCAGSFRVGALVPALLKANQDVHIDVYTTMPNRYSSYQASAKEYEDFGRLKVYRKKTPSHKSGFLDQAFAFSTYFFWVLKQMRSKEYDLVIATSSRLFTAFLGAIVASRVHSPQLLLDIRDILSDTMDSLLPTLPRVILVPVFKAIERFTFKQASSINFVSPAFRAYYGQLLSGKKVTEYTNGIDDCFLTHSFKKTPRVGKLKVVYAGNIGAGQGLIDILPQAAQALMSECEFQVIGDGGQQAVFKKAIASLPNIKLFPPVSRQALNTLYDEADILFLHLADCEAFKKVLPSKIFEYAATNKIIVAGVSGYAAQFLKEQVSHCYVFHPGDAAEMVRIFKKLAASPLRSPDRTHFIQTYSREKIMREWAQMIAHSF